MSSASYWKYTSKASDACPGRRIEYPSPRARVQFDHGNSTYMFQASSLFDLAAASCAVWDAAAQEAVDFFVLFLHGEGDMNKYPESLALRLREHNTKTWREGVR